MAQSKREKKPKYKTGIVVAVPLPGKKFAFAKVFNDFDLGVYDFITDKIETLDRITSHKIAFFLSATSAPIKSGEWPVLGEEPFPNKDSAWGPPKVSGILPGMDLDPLSISITHKGVRRRAKVSEVVGMEMDMFCQRPELFVEIVVDRLVKKNHDKYRVRP